MPIRKLKWIQKKMYLSIFKYSNQKDNRVSFKQEGNMKSTQAFVIETGKLFKNFCGNLFNQGLRYQFRNPDSATASARRYHPRLSKSSNKIVIWLDWIFITIWAAAVKKRIGLRIPEIRRWAWSWQKCIIDYNAKNSLKISCRMKRNRIGHRTFSNDSKFIIIWMRMCNPKTWV